MENNYQTQIPFEFHGEGRSYFRIWAVNLFLSLISLGVYSAWAKVRSNRYFYSHLHLDGSSFEYLANPLNILLGRLIAVVLFVTYSLVSRYLPEFSIWFLAALIPVVPWIMLKSLQFRARNSAFRNIRFHFKGSYPKALLAMGIYPSLVIAPSLFWPNWVEAEFSVSETGDYSQFLTYMITANCVSVLILGFALHNYYHYVVSNSSYGTTRFEFRSSVREYYGLLASIFFSSLGWLCVGSLVFVAFSMFIPEEIKYAEPGVLFYLFAALGMIIYVWVVAMFAAGTTNRLCNGFLIPSWYTFKSDVSSWGFFQLYFINTLLIVLTLGLYIPFAKIRMINYRVSKLNFISTLSLDEFVFDNDEDVAALGQEMGEMFDLGLGL